MTASITWADFFSADRVALAALKRDLVAYRLAFGQPRQQKVLAMVHGSAVTVQEMDEWTLDPPARGGRVRSGEHRA